MRRRFSPLAVFGYGLILAAGPSFSTGAEAASSLFAPAGAERVEEKPAPPAPEVQPSSPAPETEPAPTTAERATVSTPPSQTVEAEPEPEAVRLLPATFAPTMIKSGSAELLVDARGNKTLVIRGDDRPQVMADDGGGQTQVLLGDNTAGLVMDARGQKTLVVRGQPEPPAEAGAEPRTAAPVKPAAPGEKPYWVVERTEPEKPYFQVDEVPDDGPYWRVAKSDQGDAPYWKVEQTPKERPYWLPEPEVVEIRPSDIQPVPLPQVAALAPAVKDPNTISYYMYKDERGVKHLTNAPNDPRYQLFTTVVKVQRGLSSSVARTRFTHDSLRPVIMRAAAVHNLDPALIAAVIKSESAFDSQAVSWAGAQGLMQLMPGTARDMGVLDPFDPEDNVMGGSRYLRRMLNRFGGDLTLAIAAYNCGPERVAKVWRVPNIAETQNYVKIVLRNYEKYQLQF